MERVAGQVGAVVARALAEREAGEAGLAAASESLERWSDDIAAGDARIEAAMSNSQDPFALSFGEPVLSAFDPGPFGPVTVVAADGSSIAPDRYAPVHCYVVNIGVAVLPYGTPVPASLSARPLAGPTLSPDSLDLPGGAVNLLRDVMELEGGVATAMAARDGGDLVLLMDGTLLPWDLDSPAIPEAVRNVLRVRTRDALDTLAAAGPALSVAAYVSASRASDVANSLQALHSSPPPLWPASDGVIFRGILADGQRSALFRAQSHRPGRVEQGFSPEHDICFFYVAVGGDIARVELPHWAATAGRMLRLHAAIVDQCRRCNGYPRVLQEAHEQAVISMSDRQAFSRLLDSEASRQGLRNPLAGKQNSKRRRSV
ncbi:hypothetical protein AYO38_02130 [bacterium SCGC AG-212-C10]|nr:hypothetical protein AYO38_02130 [bacterium SCGC AG-212-C10]